MMNRFSGPRLKIERAGLHIAQLRTVVDEFCQRADYAFIAELDANTGEHLLRYRHTPLPQDIALLIGDAVHNLHSALDILACELMELGGGTVRKRTGFPFAETQAGLEETATDKLKGADQGVIQFIVDVVKPYGRVGAGPYNSPGHGVSGNPPLCAVHRLDIEDKHRLILPVVPISRWLDLVVVDGFGNPVPANFVTLIAGQDGGILPARSNSPMSVVGSSRPGISVVFPSGYPYEGERVDDYIPRIQRQVDVAVETIVAKYEELHP